MLKQINVKDMKEIVKRVYTSNLGKSLAFLGKGGIGKSEIMKSLSEELGIGYLDIRLLQYSLTDFKGIPFKSDIDGYTKFLMSDILPRKATVGEDATDPRFQDNGILVLDEITSAPKSLRTLVYQLTNERCLGDYRLPDGWVVVLLGNGSEDGGDFNGIEGNLLNRCFSYRVEVSVEDFQNYVENRFSNSVSNIINGYLSYKREHIHTFDPNKLDEDDLVFASPRSWVKVGEILEDCFVSNKLDGISEILIQGAIGVEVGVDFIEYVKLASKLPSLENIQKGHYDFISGSPTVNIKVKDTKLIIPSLSSAGSTECLKIKEEIETAKNRALGTTITYGLFNSLIETYNKIPQESLNKIDQLGVNGIDSKVDNYINSAVFTVNFISDYLPAENLKSFIDLLESSDKIKHKLHNKDIGMFISLTVCSDKVQDSKYCRGGIRELSNQFLALDGKIDIELN